jgi:hypothetical protein
VHSTMMNWRLPNSERMGIVYRLGNIKRMTWGIVSPSQDVRQGYNTAETLHSPIMIPNAHIPDGKVDLEYSERKNCHSPPNANEN